MPRSGFSLTRVSLMTSRCHCQFLYCGLRSLSTEFSGNSKQGLYFHCKVQVFTIFLEAMLKLFSDYFCWEQNEMEKNWRRQCQSSEGKLFVLRYESEPSRVESSVSRSSAYYQYCHSDLSVALGGKNDIDKKHRPWSVAKNWKKSNFS